MTAGQWVGAVAAVVFWFGFGRVLYTEWRVHARPGAVGPGRSRVSDRSITDRRTQP